MRKILIDKTKNLCQSTKVFSGADDEARTRYLHLGKVALYQMSYIRNCKRDYSKEFRCCQEDFLNFF